MIVLLKEFTSTKAFTMDIKFISSNFLVIGSCAAILFSAGSALAASAPTIATLTLTAPTVTPVADGSFRLAQRDLRKPRSRRRTRRSRRRNASAPARVTNAIVGRWGILRKDNKDVGCVLSLHPRGRAQLGPGCGDQGIVIFDPRRWRVSRGLLILQARKGHRISFSPTPGGIWHRNPVSKVPLALKKY